MEENRPIALLFDDEDLTTQSLTRFLEKKYDVISAKNEIDFVEALNREPALIYCDLILPGRSGLEYLREARTKSPCSARILISGFLDREVLLQAINEDLAHRVLAKPWTLEQLEIVTAEAYQVHALLKERTYWQEVSLTDGLTHLWNRRGLLQTLLREIQRARRHNRFLSLLMIDVDRFKDINDHQGHGVGDQSLQAVAKALSESVRSIDWVCRYGGDEFTVLLPETGQDAAFEIAERLRREITDRTGLTISLGLSVFPFHGQDPAALIEAADRALYSAKSAGRNQTAIASQQAPE